MGNIFDIIDEAQILKKSEACIYGIKQGLSGLSTDFGFHIDDAWKNNSIFDLNYSIRYRLNSSRFHFHLLYNQILFFRNKHQALVSSPVPPGFHLETDKQEHSSIMDSIVFHLSSILDYSSILINYILSKSLKNIKWSSIVKSAKNKANIFKDKKNEEIRSTILEIDSDFGNPLYVYRSELIHNSDDICNYDYSWNPTSGKVTLTFLCSKKVLKYFKKMGDKTNKYSITYFAQFVVFEVIDSLKKIIVSLRRYLKDNLSEDQFVVSNKNPLILFDQEGNKLGAASIYNWAEFDRIFNINQTE